MDLSDTDKSKLRDTFAVRATVSGNLMNFIGLDEVRSRFPDMWERNRDRIVATTRTILKQFTDAGTDIVLPVGDANFVVLFTQLDKQEALLRAAMIKAEVLRRFLGDDALDVLDVQIQAMELDSGTLMGGTLGSLLGSESSTGSDECPGSRTEPAVGTHPASAQDGPTPAALPFEVQAQQFEFSFDALRFGFQPFLHTAKETFSVFACRAARSSATGNALTDYDVLPRDADPDQIATLDKLVLMQARHGLVDMATRKHAAIVVVPVSFETMTSRSCATEYLSILQKVPSDLSKYLVPILRRCPVGVPEGRLAEIMEPLKRLGRAVSMGFESVRQPLAVIKAAGASSIGINVSGTGMAVPGFIERHGRTARKLGLRTFVDGVDTPEMAARCRAAGIDYMGGRMFAEMCDRVTPMSGIRTSTATPVHGPTRSPLAA